MDQLSCREQSGLREGSHQLLLGAVAAWYASASQGVCPLRRTVAGGALRRTSRAMLQTSPASARSGALPRCALTKARCPGRIASIGAATAGWSLAGQLRSDLAVINDASWQADWHKRDD